MDEISESSEKEELKEQKNKNFIICKENQIEYIKENINDNKEKNMKELSSSNDTYKIEKEVIIEDLQKMLERIRKRKEKLVNTKKANKDRIKNLKQK